MRKYTGHSRYDIWAQHTIDDIWNACLARAQDVVTQCGEIFVDAPHRNKGEGSKDGGHHHVVGIMNIWRGGVKRARAQDSTIFSTKPREAPAETVLVALRARLKPADEKMGAVGQGAGTSRIEMRRTDSKRARAG